jgi:uncharacterized protein with HEPN domain
VRDDRLYLINIKEAVDRIQHYVEDGREAFSTSTLIQDAVLRNFQTIGQSAGRISDDLRKRHSDVDWRGIVGFRNVLVHDYLGVDLDRVWQVVERDLPELEQQIALILQSEDD